jgi:hypothetical protein
VNQNQRGCTADNNYFKKEDERKKEKTKEKRNETKKQRKKKIRHTTECCERQMRCEDKERRIKIIDS